MLFKKFMEKTVFFASTNKSNENWIGGFFGIRRATTALRQTYNKTRKVKFLLIKLKKIPWAFRIES